MKTTLFTILIAIASLGKAQITLENSYSAVNNSGITMVHFSQSGAKYLAYGTNNLKFYNLNHSLWKTVQLPIPFNQKLFMVCNMSETLFNSDANIEVAYITWNTNYTTSPASYTFLGKVIDEAGTAIMTLPDCSGMAVVNSVTNGWKMIAIIDSVGKWSPKNYNVYSLPGTITSLATQGAPSSEVALSEAMPNPSQNRTTIAYVLPQGVSSSEIVIYNVSGQELKRYTVDGAFNTLELDNSDLPSGTYLYQLSCQPGAKKMIVIK